MPGLIASVMLVALCFALALALASDSRSPSEGSVQPASSVLDRGYGDVPLSFIRNSGQTDDRVSHFAKGAGFSFYLTKDKAVLAFGKRGRKQVLHLRFLGANPQPRIVGSEAGGTVNYLKGSDPTKWRSHLPTYREVRYQDLWPGIDMIFRGHAGGLEYEFDVAPGADVADIQLAYDGAKRISVSDSGRLLIRTDLGVLRDDAPHSFQMVGGRRVELGTRFVLRQGGSGTRYGFAVDGYDARRALRIDPRLAYSTYLGGLYGSSGAYDVAVDAQGYAYVTGSTTEDDFPATAGAFQESPDANASGDQDAFVTKLDQTGSDLVYSTFMGGTNADGGSGIAIDDNGNAYVTGSTGSFNFPTTAGAADTTTSGGDAFIAKLNATGSDLIYSTYLGGTGSESAFDIAIDGTRNAYVTGDTSSSDFLATPGAFDTSFGGGAASPDAFVAKLNPAGSAFAYSTYLGGSASDAGYGIAVDGTGNVYVGGVANSSDFPTTPGAFDTTGSTDAFITKVNAAGSNLIYSTYLGGTGSIVARGIAIDGAGSAIVIGRTEGDFPATTPGAFQTSRMGGDDGFVAKLNASGSALTYLTRLGGNSDDLPYGIAVDEAGDAWVTGSTRSSDFPVTAGAAGAGPKGYYDLFVTELNATGSGLGYSTSVGGEYAEYGYGITLDHAGNAYAVGEAASNGLATPDAFDTIAENTDAFVTKIDVTAPPAALELTPASASAPIGTDRCVTATVTDVAGDPKPNTLVRFSITGIRTRSRQVTTDVGGEAATCYTSAEVGSDTISAYADVNRNATREGTEPGGTASQTWTAAIAPATVLVDGDDDGSDAGGCGDLANPCNTIQEGVDVAEPGDTVEVDTSAQAYAEEVTVDKAALELIGPQAGVPRYTSPGGPGLNEEALLSSPSGPDAALTITAPGVRVDGLAIRDAAASPGGIARGLDAREEDAVIVDNVFLEPGRGVEISDNSAQVRENSFLWTGQRAGTIGVVSTADSAGVEIVDNIFDGGGTAVQLSHASSVVIESNLVQSLAPDLVRGVSLLSAAGASVRDNVLIGLDGGIDIFGGSGISITGNLIADSLVTGITFEQGDFAGPARNVVVSGNELLDNGGPGYFQPNGGIYVEAGAIQDTLKVVANRIAGNNFDQWSAGVQVDRFTATPPLVDAWNNWWGCNEGPGLGGCDFVRGNVDARSWLVLSLDANPAKVSVPGGSELRAHLDRTNGGTLVPEAQAFPDVSIDLEKVAGPGELSGLALVTSSGSGTAMLTSPSIGVSTVRALLDNGAATTTVEFTPKAQAAAIRDLIRPSLSRASVKPKRFAVDSRGTAEKRVSAGARHGTAFHYTLSETALVTFTVDQVQRGRRSGRRCLLPRAGNRRKPRCTRHRTIGSFALQSKPGVNSKPFSGKIGGMSLSKGRYRLTIRAKDAAGNRSKAKLLTFRVVRP